MCSYSSKKCFLNNFTFILSDKSIYRRAVKLSIILKTIPSSWKLSHSLHENYPIILKTIPSSWKLSHSLHENYPIILKTIPSSWKLSHSLHENYPIILKTIPSSWKLSHPLLENNLLDSFRWCYWYSDHPPIIIICASLHSRISRLMSETIFSSDEMALLRGFMDAAVMLAVETESKVSKLSFLRLINLWFLYY